VWHRDFGIRAAVAMGCIAATPWWGRGEEPHPDQLFVFGDCVSIANRLLHRARAGEFVLSETLRDLAAEMGVTLDAEPLPALEIPRRDPIKLYGVVLERAWTSLASAASRGAARALGTQRGDGGRSAREHPDLVAPRSFAS